MPRFKCNNTGCDKFGEVELIPHVKFVWNEKTSKLEANEALCPTCHSVRETVREPGDIKMPWFKAENARNYDNKRVKKLKDQPTEKDFQNERIKVPSKARKV